MSDNLPTEPSPSTEAGIPNGSTNISGGANLDAQRDINIGGDVVGHDKISTNIDTDGGASIAGNVTLSENSEFVGRDKTVVQTITNIITADLKKPMGTLLIAVLIPYLFVSMCLQIWFRQCSLPVLACIAPFSLGMLVASSLLRNRTAIVLSLLAFALTLIGIVAYGIWLQQFLRQLPQFR